MVLTWSLGVIIRIKDIHVEPPLVILKKRFMGPTCHPSVSFFLLSLYSLFSLLSSFLSTSAISRAGSGAAVAAGKR